MGIISCHVASPFHFKVTDYNKDFYEPVIQGTSDHTLLAMQCG